MLFNSFEFGVFFIAVYCIYLYSGHRWQNRSLLIASYIFYGSWNWKFLGLIWISTGVDYLCGLKIHESDNVKKRRHFLVISMCTNLGILGFFKYFNFFAASFHDLMQTLGWHADPLTLNIVLPVGISFYTFQTMSYTIDIYRKKIEPTRRFFDFALFVAFFPQLVAGPIERAKRLLPQVLNPRVITREQVSQGCWLFFWGLFKKVYIADNLAQIVDPVFGSTGTASGAEILVAVYAFSFQIYGDFSGYSDMARGISKLLGFELMLNFRAPYFAGNIREFWQRWHISLSTWLKDYLYISLGGNRSGALNTYRNLMVTMLLGGLWHGAAWTFILWGGFHGMVLILHRMTMPLLRKISLRSKLSDYLWKCVCICTTFHLVCLGWLMFRAQSFGQIRSFLFQMLVDLKPDPAIYPQLIKLFFCLSLLTVVQVFKERTNDPYTILNWPPLIRGGIYLIVLLSIIIGGVQGGQEFIYFQF
ncbi:MAG: MBOAT family protein [Desulfobacteraceae bacterium]|nr:MAG: MBOAT family protein [Desulfobacteraceae bacterium]